VISVKSHEADAANSSRTNNEGDKGKVFALAHGSLPSVDDLEVSFLPDEKR